MLNPIRRALGSALALSLLAMQAAAGVPIALPTDESPTAWRSALELADLEAADTVADAAIRVRVHGDRWQVIARSADGRERREMVDRPITPREREEVALLALSLIRSLDLAATPRASLPPAPSPPAPSVVPTRPAPAPAAIPTLAPEPAPLEPPAPEPQPETPASATSSTPPTLAPPLPESPAVSTEVIEGEEYVAVQPRARQKLQTPGFYVGGPLTWRSDQRVATGFIIGTELVRRGRYAQQFELEIGAAAGLTGRVTAPNAFLNRQVQMFTTRTLAAVEASKFLSVHATVALSNHNYRQQWRQVQSLWSPSAGVGLEIVPIEIGPLVPVAVRGTVSMDMSTIRMFDEFGAQSERPQIWFNFALITKIRGLNDPKAPSWTWSRR